MNGHPFVRAQEMAWLQSSRVRVGVEKARGTIRHAIWGRRRVDVFQQLRGGIPGYVGGLRIFDERDRRWYSDMENPLQILNILAGNRSLVVRKRYEGAPFEIRMNLELAGAWLRWDVEIEKSHASVLDRSLRVYYQMPAIAGWNVWAPCKGGEEFTFDGMTSFEFMHLQVPWVSDREVILPMMSHFHRGLDVGFSMLLPIEAWVPAAKFQFSNGDKCFAWGAFEKDLRDVSHLEAVQSFIGLVKERPLRARLWLLFHEGCWRPALGRVFQRWRRFFVPSNPRMYEDEGVFLCASLHAELRGAARSGLKTLEVHDHFEHYSVYAPEKSKWLRNSVKEAVWSFFQSRPELRDREGVKDERGLMAWLASHTDRAIAQAALEGGLGLPAWARGRLYGRRIEDWSDSEVDQLLYWTVGRLRERLQQARRLGISPFWYFNYSDGFRPVAEERWPDAISRDSSGEPIPSGWMMCHNMNPDPRWSFGRDLLRQARRIVHMFPEIRGLFLDCFRHYEVDFAHDDGITVVQGRPAYSINFAFDEIERRLRRILHPRGLATFANKPETLRTLRWCDGLMLEGGGDRMEEKYFWGAIARPLIFLWSSDEHSPEENYRRAVLHGCFPKLIRGDGLDAADRRQLRRYLPLFEALRRRVLCFEPDPLRVPTGWRGKLYTVGRDYVASVVNLAVGERDRILYGKPPRVLFRVRRAPDVGRVGVRYPGDRTWRFVRFGFDGTFLSVPLSRSARCAVVRLFITRRTGRRIRMQPFPVVLDRCGDPQSAFEDLSERPSVGPSKSVRRKRGSDSPT